MVITNDTLVRVPVILAVAMLLCVWSGVQPQGAGQIAAAQAEKEAALSADGALKRLQDRGAKIVSPEELQQAVPRKFGKGTTPSNAIKSRAYVSEQKTASTSLTAATAQTFICSPGPECACNRKSASGPAAP